MAESGAAGRAALKLQVRARCGWVSGNAEALGVDETVQTPRQSEGLGQRRMGTGTSTVRAAGSKQGAADGEEPPKVGGGQGSIMQ